MNGIAYTRFELLRTFRNRRFLLFSLGFPLVFFWLIAAPQHNKIISATGLTYATYYTVSLASFGTMMSMISTGARIAGERQAGWTRQLRISPLSVRAYFRANLIQKWLRAGVIEDGRWTASEEGSPQGATVSPLLANVYLHYVFDLWVQQWRTRHARGEVIAVRYADDAVLGFQHQSDAERFREELERRLTMFGLALNTEKTRLVRFGRYAAQQRAERGLGKPETFDFLGFTHYCAKRKDGHFAVRRRTIKKRQVAKLKQVKAMLMARRHWPIEEQGRWLGSVVRGHLAYYSVPGNIQQVSAFRQEVIRLWRAALRRRSQKARMNWQRMRRLAERYLPRAHYTHPWPDQRFAARTQVRSPVR